MKQMTFLRIYQAIAYQETLVINLLYKKPLSKNNHQLLIMKINIQKISPSIKSNLILINSTSILSKRFFFIQIVFFINFAVYLRILIGL